MPGKLDKKPNNQAKNSHAERLIPTGSIKTEKTDDFVLTMRPIKTEKPDGNNNSISNNNNQLRVNIKTEKPDGYDSDVIFVPNPAPTIIVINDGAPPPQKKSKLNNGNAKSRNTAVIKKEVSSPVRNRAARNNKRPRNNFNNFSNGNNYGPNRGQLYLATAVSERILRSTIISNGEMRLLTQACRQEILDLFHFLWVQAEIEYNDNCVDRLVVAKIQVVNRSNLSLDSIYCSMRRDMVGWIERCQARGQRTPIFYSAVIDRPYITVMCAGSHSYNCLFEYISHTYAKTPNCGVSIRFLPSYNGRTLYCYAATADDIVFDTARFLNQIHMHIGNVSNEGGSPINANRWIIARHRIHEADKFTSFIFFMDYISHLTLEHVFKNSLSVCMLAVKFAYRGIVPCNF